MTEKVTLKVKTKILDQHLYTNNMLPFYGSKSAAAMDLRASIKEKLVLYPGETKLVGTGVAMYLDSAVEQVNGGLAALLLPRSGLGSRGIILGNTVGLIDSDYQGEIKAMLWNRSDEVQTIEPYERMVQLMIIEVKNVELDVVKDFEASERGEGGFGNSGKF